MSRTTESVKWVIQKTLTEHGPLTWTQLWERSQLSKGAVSKHLEQLMKRGSVERVVDAEKRPPHVLYKLVEAKSTEIPKEFQGLEGYENLVKTAAITAFREGLAIGKMKDRDTAKNVLKGYLKTNLLWIAAWLSAQVPLAYAFAKGYTGVGEVPKADPKKLKKVLKIFRKTIRKDMHEFLEPWIEALGQAHFANHDIAYGGDGAFAEAAREFNSKVDVGWYDVLEKSERLG